jgi:hypothetical protein
MKSAVVSADLNDVLDAVLARESDEVLTEVEREVREQRGVDRIDRPAHQKRLAVWPRSHNLRSGDIAAVTRNIDDYEVLSKQRR